MNTPSAPATPRLPALLTGLLFAGAIVLAAFLLDALARAQLRAHLVDSAVRTLAALERGDTPARWNLAVAADVVGGRAFDAAASRIDDAGLHARSSGQAFEIGLVLPAPIDLERLSILHVAIEAQATGTLALSLRDTLDGPLCANAPLALATGVQTLRIDLDAPGWQCAGDAAGPPSRAAMLRLRIGLPAEANVRVMDVRLDPRNAFDRQSLQAVALDPPIDAAATAALERIAPTHWPLVEIGLRARVERTRLAIDRIRAVAPAAIILPRGELGAVIASARTEASAVAPAPRAGTFPAWALVAALASALAWVRWRSWSSPRWQAAAEL
ncbi:MAG: hypothetical protein J0L88_07795, partial [Xanthomonadales bacterium]|nr:hypothetical protein [Xanthomonadales bacterium]